MALTTDDLQRVQAIQEHGWRWFSYHAEQRTTMFNFFLTAAAILIAGFVGAVADGNRWVAFAIGLVGFLVSVCFIMLDIRNQALVGLGEDVIDKFEEAVFRNRVGGAAQLVVIDGVEFPKGVHTAEPARRRFDGIRLGKHKVYLRGIQGILALVFLIGMVVAWVSPEMLESRDKADLVKIRNDMQELKTQLRSLEGKISSASNGVPAAVVQ